MTQPNPQLPTLSTPSVTRVEHSTKAKRKQKTRKHKAKFHTTAPVHNTISHGSNSRLRQINKIIGQWKRSQRNKPSDSDHRARNTTQNPYCNDNYDNNKKAIKLEGTTVHQQQK